MKLTALNISSNVIKYVTTNGNGSVKHGSISPDGLINNGLILQPDAIASQIKAIFAANRLPKDRVICSINGLPFSYRLFTLPKMEPVAFDEAIVRVIRKEMPISPDEMYLLWQAYPAENKEWQVLVAGITRQPVDNLIKTLSAAGIKPYFLDLQHLSLARLTGESDAIIVECEKDYSNIVMLIGGVPQALHIIPSLGPQAALTDEIHQLAGRLNKMVNFYNTNNPRNPIKETSKVLLTGELVNDGRVVGLVQQEVDYKVELLSPVDKAVSKMPLHEFAVNAGSILMKVAPEKEAGRDTAPHRSINLARIARHLQTANITSVSSKGIIGTIAAFTGIAALLFGFLSQNQAQGDFAQAQEQLAQANAEYSAIRSALDASQAVQDNINEVKAQVQLVNSNYASILNSTDYVSDIAAITQSVPDGVLFTTLEIGSSWISVYGRAYTSASVVDFARNLELIGDFSKADIQRIDWAHSAIGPSLSFSIVINK
jgi:Tfp pilus assembly PilM family ATPase/Tfp pilus assembly protein PilN